MPELAEIRYLTQRMDYAGLAGALLALHDRDERLLPAAGVVAAAEPGLHDLVMERLRLHGDDILAKALLAHGLISRGWAVRSSHRATDVSPGQFAQFHAHLGDAEVHLIEVCAVEPSWTYPWYLRQLTARGLELGTSESWRRYERLAELSQHHYPAQGQLLQQLCPKWGGSWEAAFDFARSCAGAASLGSPEHGILAELHLEHWIELDREAGARYLRQPDVLGELQAAASASVFHEEFQPGFSWVRLHTAFGALFALSGDEEAAARHFAVLGDVVDPGVWGYLSSAERIVQRARKAALARSGAA